MTQSELFSGPAKELELFIIDAPHFFAGGVVRDGKVVEVAPIIKYMKGWAVTRVRVYCKQKRWALREM